MKPQYYIPIASGYIAINAHGRVCGILVPIPHVTELEVERACKVPSSSSSNVPFIEHLGRPPDQYFRNFKQVDF